MTSFASGTPNSYITDFNDWFYRGGLQPRVGEDYNWNQWNPNNLAPDEWYWQEGERAAAGLPSFFGDLFPYREQPPVFNSKAEQEAWEYNNPALPPSIQQSVLTPVSPPTRGRMPQLPGALPEGYTIAADGSIVFQGPSEFSQNVVNQQPIETVFDPNGRFVGTGERPEGLPHTNIFDPSEVFLSSENPFSSFVNPLTISTPAFRPQPVELPGAAVTLPDAIQARDAVGIEGEEGFVPAVDFVPGTVVNQRDFETGQFTNFFNEILTPEAFLNPGPPAVIPDGGSSPDPQGALPPVAPAPLATAPAVAPQAAPTASEEPWYHGGGY
tara:strand:- start:5400 stop:6377 length:978 start_codon:yes stop_codon:yes gene_type:complete